MTRDSLRLVVAALLASTAMLGSACIYFESPSGDDDEDAAGVLDGGRDAGGESRDDTDDRQDSGSDDAIEPDPDVLEEEDTGPVDDWPARLAEAEAEVLRLVNVERAAGANCGGVEYGPAGPLVMDALLREVARAHSLDMGERDYFDHTNPDGDDPFDRMEAAGFNGASPWGENIAAGQTSAAMVVSGWMDSPGHCQNIMEPGYRALGVGYAQVAGSSYAHYWTQVFAGSTQR